MSHNDNNINNLNEKIQENDPINEGLNESSSAQNNEQSSTQPESKDKDSFENKIKILEEQVKEKDQKYIYLYAEFENYKKRIDKEKVDVIKFGWEPIARDFLSVLDNLERALSYVNPENTDKNLNEGLQMILKQFQSTLDRHGVKTIESLEKTFDPHLHEAVGQESSEKHAEGTVIKEHTKGYLLNGRLLRPAQVVVSKAS